eukprot:Gregarina_sp_Pseudo_9__1362@NODE_1911_length_1259_cov_22_677049_g1772_i0_p3_GENE_NODE_1911_length_1259_cov_22_677049_g1772_i0NODE_1911_length_1259_cov_22_677049_g1772_i0_p3_ORF_typecomplete_len103_score8_46_NODE_1911_length_1259_cov_22_677049_g1772_i0574882
MGMARPNSADWTKGLLTTWCHSIATSRNSMPSRNTATAPSADTPPKQFMGVLSYVCGSHTLTHTPPHSGTGPRPGWSKASSTGIVRLNVTVRDSASSIVDGD